MRNLWFLMLLGACVDEDVARVEQRLVETYDVCAKDGCTPCWIADGKERCEKPVDFAAHRGLARTDLVFASNMHEIALWSLQNGWRTVSPTEPAGGVLRAADYDGDGGLEISTVVGTAVKSPRDAASGLATGRRQHLPMTLTMELGRLADLDGDGATDIVWVGAKGEVEVGFVKADKTEPVDPTYALSGWALVGAGDFDGTKTDDLVWRAGDRLRIRSMAGAKVIAEREELAPTAWTFVGAADLDKDRRADIVWRDGKGDLIVWPSGSPKNATTQALAPALRIEVLRDLDGDGAADLLVRDGEKSVVYTLLDKAWQPTGASFTHDDVWSAQT